VTYDDFKVWIRPLALHFRQERDRPTWMLYHAALMAQPAPSRAVLDRALLRAANRRFFPSTEELRSDAELERQALLKAHPHERCTECRDNSGWVTVLVDGVARVQRCDCWTRYRQALEQLGVGHQPLALPAARDEATP
jgi:hypothetical protein